MTQKQRSGQKVKLVSVDELLKVPEGEATEKIAIRDIRPFCNHPFKVIDDDKMDELVESIRENGILTPIIVRTLSSGGYEMISGHRRMHAAKLLGIETIPAVVKELSDEDATVIMVDSNIQREELLPSEKAFAYKMRLDAMKRQGARTDLISKQVEKSHTTNATFAQDERRFNNGIASAQNERKRRLESADEMATEVGDSRAQIRRYIRLTELIPELLEMVDEKKLPFMTAVDISFLSHEIQKYLCEYIHENGMVKAYQITALRNYLQNEENISQIKMIQLLNDNLPGRNPAAKKKVTFTETKLRKFFPPHYTMDEMEKIMIQLLTQWKEGQTEDEI